MILRTVKTIEQLDECVRAYVNGVLQGTPNDALIERRVNQIREYLKTNRIKNVVLGVSGGVDSALVLKLLEKVNESYPIAIHACVFTFDLYEGIFNRTYVDVLKKTSPIVNWIERDLSRTHREMWNDLNLIHSIDHEANVSYAMRYNALFAVAQSVGGITFGTTNYDEYGYVGWFGKTSDMVVDVQPIIDLHKFQVIECALKLGVPRSICHRVPTGDLIDSSSDEDNFGVSYDELGWFTEQINQFCNLPSDRLKPTYPTIDVQRINMSPFIRANFHKVMQLHEKNAHKYQSRRFNPIFIA